MQIPPAPRVKIPAEQRWLERVLSGHFEFIQDISRAFQAQIGLDNINAERRSLALTHNVPINVTTQTLRGEIVTVLLLRADIDDFVRLRWTPLATNRFTVAIKADSAPAEPIKCDILIIGT